ncbi:hypothetical protein [Brumimicrobium mesophilum]|uniref:hypothetical protein n=1 Tax=Brumimicrobium mesophilum TaxID=392717 RepID=UPI000D13F8A8|nr:hypothetical protein [Brumimicrobium mesophilum]
MAIKFNQYFAIEKRIKSLGVDIDREDVISELTGGKKDSLRSLTPHEYKELLYAMTKTLGNEANRMQKSMDAQRKKIIAHLAKVGYTTPEGKADMKSIYSWVLKYGYLHKGLNDYTAKELPFLVSQSHNVYKKFIKAL